MVQNQVAENHIVNGRIFASSLDDDFVGQTISNSKLRANLYLTEDHEWKEFHVSDCNFFCWEMKIGILLLS